jgi:hypothetical protein
VWYPYGVVRLGGVVSLWCGSDGWCGILMVWFGWVVWYPYGVVRLGGVVSLWCGSAGVVWYPYAG